MVLVMNFFFSFNSRRYGVRKPMIATAKSVSRKRSFNNLSEDQIEELMEDTMPKKSFSKLKWGEQHTGSGMKID